MPLSLGQLRGKVVARIGLGVYSSALEFLRKQKLHLWGSEQPPKYLELNFLLTVRRLLNGKGFRKNLEKYDQQIHLSHRSLEHNSSIILRKLGVWGKSTVLLGSLRVWERAARNAVRGDLFKVFFYPLRNFDLAKFLLTDASMSSYGLIPLTCRGRASKENQDRRAIAGALSCMGRAGVT